jgi:hypothetical protein
MIGLVEEFDESSKTEEIFKCGNQEVRKIERGSRCSFF